MIRPVGWTDEQLAGFHPLFRDPLVAAVIRAQKEQHLRVRLNSGWRSWAKQQQLRKAYEIAEALWKKDPTKYRRPLPASKPGSSGHNFTVCAGPLAHPLKSVVEMCPTCDAVGVVPAAVACDVMILNDVGTPIHSGGRLPRHRRPMAWQRWAGILDEFTAELRDGGEFVNVDPVHVESVWWDGKARRFMPPSPLDAVPFPPEVPDAVA